jgi:hypothetical protein
MLPHCSLYLYNSNLSFFSRQEEQALQRILLESQMDCYGQTQLTDSRPPHLGGNGRRMVEGLHNFAGDGGRQIGFKAGEQLVLCEESEQPGGGWLAVEKDGTLGIVPENYTKPAPVRVPQSPPPPPLPPPLPVLPTSQPTYSPVHYSRALPSASSAPPLPPVPSTRFDTIPNPPLPLPARAHEPEFKDDDCPSCGDLLRFFAMPGHDPCKVGLTPEFLREGQLTLIQG